MNALLGIRTNATGFLSPTPQQRQEVAQQLATQKIRSQPPLVPSAATTKMDEAGAAEGAEGGRNVGNDLDRNAFLQLLVLELQHQDPLAPMDNREMVTQLAQFSSLEQMQNLNTEFQQLSGNVDQLNFITANSLVGRTVRGINDAGQIVEGKVEGVQLDGSIVLLRLEDGSLPMTGVAEILK